MKIAISTNKYVPSTMISFQILNEKSLVMIPVFANAFASI